VPEDFRFAVKLPREITHRRKLVDTVEPPLERFLGEIAALGPRLGPVLIQLPPKFAFDEHRVCGFFDVLRARFAGSLVCEPRHASWFTDPVDVVLTRYRIARVAADPAVVPLAAMPGGWPELIYYRLHGAPRMYYSAYEPEQLDRFAAALTDAAQQRRDCWCIFDNTARRAATVDALALSARLDSTATAHRYRS
jgi:uncharacterized protein YecE (DUF72 family)